MVSLFWLFIDCGTAARVRPKHVGLEAAVAYLEIHV